MIAAIASCIFVIYLYRSLNEAEVDEPSQSQETAVEGELAERLSALEARLHALIEDQSGGASS